MLTETNLQRYRLALLVVSMTILSVCCRAAESPVVSKPFYDSLRSLERTINRRKISMEELAPQLQELSRKATTDAERAAAHKCWGDALRVRQRYAEAVTSYDRCQELATTHADPKRSPVPYYKDLCKVEAVHHSMGVLGPVALAMSIICACLFLRIQPINRKALVGLAVFVVGWIILCYGVTIAVDVRKVAVYPADNQETGGNYVFVFLGTATNPYFWRFVFWGLPMLVCYWLMALNRKANRYVRYSIFPAYLILTGALVALIQVGFSWFPSRYGPERVPYFSPLAMAQGNVSWLRPLLLGLVAALAIGCLVITVIALKRKRTWSHRPCQFMAILTSSVALVGLFLHGNRKKMVHVTSEACYYEAPEIETYVKKYPDSFVNLHAEDADSEELKKFILENAPMVPPEEFQKSRRDDAK